MGPRSAPPLRAAHARRRTLAPQEAQSRKRWGPRVATPLGAAHARRRTLAAPILGFARSVVSSLRHPGSAKKASAGSRARAAPRSTRATRHRSPPRRAAACRRSAAATVARRCDRPAVRVHLGCTRDSPSPPGPEEIRRPGRPATKPSPHRPRGRCGREFSTSSRAPPGPPPAGPPGGGTASSSRSRARCGGRTPPSAGRHRARRRCRA
jgi:hypothetical protein